MVHRNFEQTDEMVNNLLNMTAKIDQLGAMLEADTQDIVGPIPISFEFITRSTSSRPFVTRLCIRQRKPPPIPGARCSFGSSN